MRALTKNKLNLIEKNFKAIAQRQKDLAEKTPLAKVKAMRDRIAASYEADIKPLKILVTCALTTNGDSIADYIDGEGWLTWRDKSGNEFCVYALTHDSGWIGKGIWFMDRFGQVRANADGKTLIKETDTDTFKNERASNE